MEQQDTPTIFAIGKTYFTTGIILILSAAAVGFMADAITKAVILTFFGEANGVDSKRTLTHTATQIAIPLAVLLQAILIATSLLDPSSANASLTYCIAAGTASLAAIGLALALATVICVRIRAMLDRPINFMARNCLILTYFVTTEEEAKRCATVVVSIMSTIALACFIAVIEKLNTTASGTVRINV